MVRCIILQKLSVSDKCWSLDRLVGADITSLSDSMFSCSFQDIVMYFGLKPKSGEKEVSPNYIFMLWYEFCNDFKNTWNRENKIISKERWGASIRPSLSRSLSLAFRDRSRVRTRRIFTTSVAAHIRTMFRTIALPEMKMFCKCAHPRLVWDQGECVSASVSQQWMWMGAVRMRADKNITIIHSPSGEDKTWNKSSIKSYLTQIP